jgi:hypothetical protein
MTNIFRRMFEGGHPDTGELLSECTSACRSSCRAVQGQGGEHGW